MTQYRKLFAAVAGIGLLIGLRQMQIEIPGLPAVVLDLAIGALTSFGVYQAKSEPA